MAALRHVSETLWETFAVEKPAGRSRPMAHTYLSFCASGERAKPSLHSHKSINSSSEDGECINMGAGSSVDSEICLLKAEREICF